MTVQQYAAFETGQTKSSATQKLVKAWESKNSKKAVKASGFTLMAVSLSACGSDDSAVDAAMADLAAAVASLTAAEAATAAAESNAAAAVASATAAEANAEAAAAATAAAEADAATAADTAAAAVAAAEAATAATAEAEAATAVAVADAAAAADAAEAAQGLQAVAEAATAVAVADAAAAVAAQEAAEADTAAAVAATEAAVAATAEAEAATAAAVAATAEAEAARDILQAQVDVLLAANTDLANRTLDVDGETFAAGDAVDYEIIVTGTAGIDNFTATVTGSGTGTLTFSFVDDRDSVSLTATDLSSYSSIVISSGTVDLTEVTLGAGVDISINSTGVMTGAQFLAAGEITSSTGEGGIEVFVSSEAEAQQVADAMDKVDGVPSELFTMTNADGSTATDDDIEAIEDEIILALDVAAASVDPVGNITAAVAEVELQLGLFLDADEALVDAAVDAQLAEAQATLDLMENEDVVAALDAEAAAAIVEAIADAETDATADLDIEAGDNVLGDAIDAALEQVTAEAALELDGVLDAELNFDMEGYISDSDAVLSAHISDQLATSDAEIEELTDDLEAATDALDGTLILARVEDLDEAGADREDAVADAEAAFEAADDAAAIAEAILNIEEADLTLDEDGDLDLDGAEGEGAAISLFAVDAEGIVSLDEEIVTVNAEDDGDYDIIVDADTTLTIDASFIDDLADATQALLSAEVAVELATEAVDDAIADVEDAFTAADADADLDFDAEGTSFEAYQDYAEIANNLENAVGDLADLNDAVASYNAFVELESAISELETVALDAGDAAADGADQGALVAAVAALENALDAEVSGLNVNYDMGVGIGQNDYAYATDLEGEESIDTVGGGLDIVDFGSEYTFTTVAADAVVDTENVGDASVLEVLLQQQSDENDLPTGVSVWIETAAADGSSSSTGDAAFTLTNDAGDLTIADLDLSVDGLIITGAYDTGLLA